MKKISLFSLGCLLIIIAAVSANAQDSRTFPLSGFSRLSMGSAFKIDVKQGSKFAVSATGRGEDLEDIEARVTDGALRIGYKRSGWNRNRKTVHISITMPALEGVEFSGASEAEVGNFSGTKRMDIEVSGASKVKMDFSAPKVSLELSGASSLVLTGQCDILNGEVSGASSFKGQDFSSKEVNINASGASSASVLASTSIHADASGASSIRYSGNAKDIHSSSSGAGSVKRN